MVQVKNAVAPFPVGIGKICGASGTADEEILTPRPLREGAFLRMMAHSKNRAAAPGPWAAARLVPERSRNLPPGSGPMSPTPGAARSG